MNAFKSAQADVKEKFQNVAAKVDEKTALNKAAAVAKAERKEAENKAGKHDAKATYHNKQAEILREYEQKKESNAAVKEQTKMALKQKKADKHTSKADQHANTLGAVHGGTSENLERDTPATAPADNRVDDQQLHITDAAARGVPAQTELGHRNSPTPTYSDAPEARENDLNASNPVHANQAPIEGTGNTLHSDNNPGTDTDGARPSPTLAGSPNNGSYM